MNSVHRKLEPQILLPSMEKNSEKPHPEMAQR